MRDVTLLVALLTATTAIGWVLLGGLGPGAGPGWRLTRGAAAPLVGILATSAVAVLLATLGIEMRVVLVLVVTAGAAVAAARTGRRRGLAPWRPRPSDGGALAIAVEAVIVALGVVICLVATRLFLVSPMQLWDGWAIWGIHAHALKVEGIASSPVFTGPAYRGTHPEYPLLYPAWEALVTRTTGDFDPTSVLLGPALLLGSAAAAIWGLLRTVVHPVVAAATAVSVLGLRLVVENFQANYADGALAVLVALGLAMLLVWLRTETTSALVLATGFLMAACLVKTEGVGFAVAAFVATAIAGLGLRRGLRPVGLAALATLAPAFAGALAMLLRGVRQDSYHLAGIVQPSYISANWDRVSVSADRLLLEVSDSWSTVLWLLVLAVVVAVVANRLWPAVFLLAWLGLSYAWLVLVYFLSTAPIEWHLLTSAARVVFTLVVGVLVVSPVIVTDAWDSLEIRLDPRLSRLRSSDDRPAV